MNLIEMLQATGIDGNKADFYLASLELGEANSASLLARNRSEPVAVENSAARRGTPSSPAPS